MIRDEIRASRMRQTGRDLKSSGTLFTGYLKDECLHEAIQYFS